MPKRNFLLNSRGQFDGLRSKGPAGPFIPSSIAICPRVPDESGWRWLWVATTSGSPPFNRGFACPCLYRYFRLNKGPGVSGNAGVMFPVERGVVTRTACLFGVILRIEPKPEVMKLHGIGFHAYCCLRAILSWKRARIFRTRRRTAFMCWRSKRNSPRNRIKDIRSIMVAGTLGLLGHARPLTQE
jgi:hypothetical protein